MGTEIVQFFFASFLASTSFLASECTTPDTAAPPCMAVATRPVAIKFVDANGALVQVESATVSDGDTELTSYDNSKVCETQTLELCGLSAIEVLGVTPGSYSYTVTSPGYLAATVNVTFGAAADPSCGAYDNPVSATAVLIATH
jgi:hypothetical protein